MKIFPCGLFFTATVGISQEIWHPNCETRRFDEKLGDSRESRESWQVCTLCIKLSVQFTTDLPIAAILSFQILLSFVKNLHR